MEEAPSQSEGELADGEVEKVTDRLRAVKVQDGTDKVTFCYQGREEGKGDIELKIHR